MKTAGRMRLLIALVPALMLVPEPANAGAEGWTTWRNARFAFSICYPADVFGQRQESPQGHGIALESKDSATMIAAAIPYGDATLAEPIRIERERLTHIGLIARGANWFVVSGTRVDQILYTKGVKAGGRLVAFRFRYPESLAARYAPIVERVSTCLHVDGNGA